MNRIYIKFTNSIFKEMNMKDFTFKADDGWAWYKRDTFIELYCVKDGNTTEILYIPWTNIIVAREF